MFLRVLTLMNCLCFGLYAQCAQIESINDGVYSKAQAKIGAKLYKINCLMCHDKKYFRPVLETWSGRTLGMLYETMSTTMPETNPAGLRQQNYVDILAYILSLSKYPVGESALEYKSNALDNITIVSKE